MDVGLLFLILLWFSHTTANIKTIEMCRYSNVFGSGTCHSNIICDTGARINITEVEYRDYWKLCTSTNCGLCCYTGLEISTEHKQSIMRFCNDKHACNLDSWKPDKTWEMRIKYVCHESSTIAPSTTATAVVSTSTTKTSLETTTVTTVSSNSPISTTGSAAPSITTAKAVSTSAAQSTPLHEMTTETKDSLSSSTDSNRKVTTNHEDTTSGSFPLAASIAIPTGLVVIILIISGFVWGVRRRFLNKTLRSQIDNCVRMQDVTNEGVERDTDNVGNYEGLVEQTEQEHVYEEGNSARMQDVINEAVERDTDYVGHYEGLGEQTEQEHVYEKANQTTFTRGSQNTYVNC